eukprot:GSMAST32.ASY1.ANO1.1226.1 assembled CDS
MSMRITQETFDEAVKENMEDLDMSKEEAIEDAVQTFEAQHVDLSNIILEGTSSGNPVLSRVKRIKEASEKCMDSLSDESIISLHDDMMSLFHDCIKGKEIRAISGCNGVVEAIIRILKTAIGSEFIEEVVATAQAKNNNNYSLETETNNSTTYKDDENMKNSKAFKNRKLIYAGVSALGTVCFIFFNLNFEFIFFSYEISYLTKKMLIFVFHNTCLNHYA